LLNLVLHFRNKLQLGQIFVINKAPEDLNKVLLDQTKAVEDLSEAPECFHVLFFGENSRQSS